MKRVAMAASLGLCLVLTGCADTERSYDTTRALLAAFKDAGGECQKQSEVPSFLIGDGATGVLCTTNGTPTMLMLFDSETNANTYVATADPGTGFGMIRGDRWVIAGPRLADMAGAMGGRVVD